MNIHFKSISLSHKKASISIRELLSLDQERSRSLLLRLKDIEGISDVLVLSTCNRTEVYYNSLEDHSDLIIQSIVEMAGNKNKEDYYSLFEMIEEPSLAMQHLFRVAIGLESQVVGDMQIINQVKTAYQMTADLGLAGPLLHRLLHTVFFTNKKVTQETPFRSGAASTSFATVELIETILSDRINASILILGLGEIGKDVLSNLKETDYQNITICSRTNDKAHAISKELDVNFLTFEDYLHGINEAEIVVSSILRDEPILHSAHFDSIPQFKYKHLIDLSVPRSIDPSVENIPGVELYNIDHINNKVNEALNKRMASIPDVEAILNSCFEEFQDWRRDMEVSPTIQKLKNALEQIRLEELDRYMKQLSEEESSKLDMITKSMMQKILKLPVLQLKAACKRGEAETLIDVLNDLFDLEKAKSNKIKIK
jgi:glutamyl-tRNA reductase